MGFKLLAITTCLLTVSTFSVEKKPAGSGCVDLLCPDTALHYGLRNLINDETLKTDACTSCDQCTENGYSVCLRLRDSRASRTAGGCSCAHQLAANCHNDLTQKVHPANLTMHLYSACYTDALQKPPQPLAANENSSIVVTIEPFWLEPYWRHLKVENLKLHYKYLVKAPEHCEGEVETTPNGIHTCINSVAVDLKDDVAEGKANDDDDYEHSDNYDQYDDELPPEVQFDRDVFAGAKQMETYFTATVRRPRQLKITGAKQDQIHDADSEIESEHLKFDMKPELYGTGEDAGAEDSGSEEKKSLEVTTQAGTTEVPIAVTEMEVDKDESAQSEELGGTNFFEEDAKKVDKEEEEESDAEKSEGVEEEKEGAVVNLEDIEPIKLKSQEDAKKKEQEEEDSEKVEASEEEDSTATNTTTISDTKSASKEEEKAEEKAEEEEKEDGESTTPESEAENDDDDNDEKSGENDSEESSTKNSSVELVEGEGASDENEEGKDKDANFLTRFTDSFDFPRVRLVFLITLAAFILFILLVLCCFYREKYCCGKKKESKNANGYRYTNANAQSTELKPVSRANSSGIAPEEHRLLNNTNVLDHFQEVVRSGTSFNPSKIELATSVGMGKFGPIYPALFSSYNGSIHDVNIYLLKNVTRLPDEQLTNLANLLKSNVAAGAHANIVTLCGVTQAGPDVMLMWEPLNQPTLQGVLRESRCPRLADEPFKYSSFLSSERLAKFAIGCCSGLDHLLKRNVYPTHISASNVLVVERGIVKIGGFGLAEHHALNSSSENVPTRLRWMPPEYFKRDSKMVLNEQTMIWPLGVVLWEIFSLGGTPFLAQRQAQGFMDSMRDGSAELEEITYCGEAVTQLLSTCTSHNPEARSDLKTIIKRLECISADVKTQINLLYRIDFPYLPIATSLEQQSEN